TYSDGSSKLMYLIFDCLCMDGKSIMDRTLDIRIGKCEAFIYTPWKELKKAYPEDVAQQPFHLELKKMQLPYAIDFMFGEVLPKLPHGNDGLIFTCKTTPYISGTDQHILKWKPPHENTIDFRLQIVGFPMTEDADGEYEDWDAKPEIELLVNYGDNDYKRYADLYVTDKEWEAMKVQNEIFDHRIVEYWLDPDLKKWRPKLDNGVPRFRDDKTDANHISTVKSVMESIEDGVTEQDLIQQQGKIREAWKLREAEGKKARDLERQKMQHAHELKERQRAEAQRQQAAAAAATAAADADDGPQYTD
ncbi:Dcp1p-Dcp2p decapping enzyme complex alpha subunit, partial [Oleoguttula sp. CCFEE 5521]